MIALDDGGDKGIQRGLHQSIAYSQQGEGKQHDDETITEDRQEKRDEGNHQREQYRTLAAYPVHQHTCGH